MCGIYGALGRESDTSLDRVAAVLAHRGPDSEGRFVDDSVSLLHRRLRVIDLSPAATQPMANEDGRVQVVFNGEIYNHGELRRELEAAGHHFRSHADTEVIVHGYEAWGEDVLGRLDGMFAFGLWDAQKRRLLLARDRAGKKPLFYTDDSETFRFGSTAAALHAAGLKRELDISSIPYFVSYGYVPPPGSFYRHVRQLEPASYLVKEAAKPARVGQYWTPRFGPERGDKPFHEAARDVRHLVTAAVRRRLESDVPLGAFLSGGVDSTIIVGVMARELADPVRTFSIGFAGDARYDETEYARLASRAFGTRHTEFVLQPSSFELVERLVREHDGPFGDSSAIPTYVVSRLTREHVTVALTGDGGDELFCGYVRFLAAEASEALPQLLRHGAARASARLPGSARERSLAARGRRFLTASSLPLADRMAHWNSFFANPADVLRPEICADLGSAVGAPLRWQREIFSTLSGDTTLARVLEHNFRTYLPNDLLVKADRSSMAHALELRSPFLDTALIEYAARLPRAYLRSWLKGKRILKEAFRDLLPESISKRKKMGFAVPLGTWFRGDLRELLNDYLGPRALVCEYIDPAVLAGLLESHQQGRADHGQRLWLLLTLEIWLRGMAQSRAAAAA